MCHPRARGSDAIHYVLQLIYLLQREGRVSTLLLDSLEKKGLRQRVVIPVALGSLSVIYEATVEK